MPLTQPVPSGPEVSLGAARASRSARASVAPLALSGALLLLVLYAGFAHGAISPSAEARLQVAVAATYVVVVCLAVAVGASHRRSVELVAAGFLLVSLVVSLYGLGQKLLPGLHILGVINLNQTGPLPRLQQPLGYWNALALFIAMGTPIALALAVDREQPRRVRLAALAAVEVMLLTIGFTYSRGGCSRSCWRSRPVLR